MNKRDFLKTSGTLLAGSVATRILPAQSQVPPQVAPQDLNRTHAPAPNEGDRTNWAGNYTFHAPRVDHPTTPTEVRDLLRSRPNLKALGSKHSFNNIADSPSDQVSLDHFTEMTLDREHRTVTVGAGVRYGKLAPWLDQQGFAVHNLASLPHISVAGGVATATHGSGIGNGNLSTAVRAIEFLSPDGNLVTLSRDRDPDTFPGAVVALGALGITTRVTLDVIPTFLVAQTVYENLSFSELEHNLDSIMGAAYSVSLFTDWQNHRATEVWLKAIAPSPEAKPLAPTFHGATLQTQKLHPIRDHDAANCTDQLGVPGPWYERLPHFKMNFTPSSGAELQTEYFVPREHGYQAILAVEKLRDLITPHLFITELRTIAADNLWMSMAYQRPSLAIHFTWKPEWQAVQPILPRIEAALAPFQARPHWAKLFTTPPDRIRTLYPRYNDFLALAQHHDPQGKLRNNYLNRNLYPA